MENPPPTVVYRFGVYEADPIARTLRRRGVPLRVQEQPFRLLLALLERRGEIVSREEIRERLWPDDTFVDFDKSVNTAVQKLRQALGDSASRPQFLETVPRVGYRFIAEAQATPYDAPYTGGDADRDHPEREAPPPEKKVVSRRAAIGWAAASLATGLAGGWAAGRFGAVDQKGPSAERAPQALRLRLREGAVHPILSPDGRKLAFHAQGLWIQDLVTGVERQVADETGRPAWSANSRFLAAPTPRELLRIDVATGGATRIAELPPGFSRSDLCWSPSGDFIAIANDEPARLFTISTRTGGPPIRLFDDPDPRVSHFMPGFVRGDERRSLLLYVRGGDETTSLMLRDLDTGHEVDLGRGVAPAHTPAGWIVFNRDNRLTALRFTGSLSRAAQTPAIDIPHVPYIRTFRMRWPSVSDFGDLVFDQSSFGRQRLIWRDRQGLLLGAVSQGRERIVGPRISPDGRHAAATVVDNGQEDIWVYDLERRTESRLTLDGGPKDRAAWAPDSRRIAFAGANPGGAGGEVMVVPLGTGSTPVPMLTGDRYEFPFDWTDHWLLFDRAHAVRSMDVWAARLEQDRVVEQIPILSTEIDELSPALSPDGRWLAYEAARSTTPEVWVQTFPDGEQRRQVSVGGGGRPRWRADGRELYYVAPGGTMTAVSMDDSAQPGPPRPLFQDPALDVGRGHTYDVTRDGNRFLLIDNLEEAPARDIVWIRDWAMALSAS